MSNTTMIESELIDHHFEVIHTMTLQEEKYYTCPDYLQSSERNCQERMVEIRCRDLIARWFFKIAKEFELRSETIEIAMSCLDRHLSVCTEKLEDRHLYQLAALTALYTAIKIHEPKFVSLDDIEILGRYQFTRDQVLEMEQEMLRSINWHVHPPTIMDFVHQLVDVIPENILPGRQIIIEMADLQVENAVCDYKSVSLKSSWISFAVIMNAIESLVHPKNHQFCWTLVSIALSLDDVPNDSIRSIQRRLRKVQTVSEWSEEPRNQEQFVNSADVDVTDLLSLNNTLKISNEEESKHPCFRTSPRSMAAAII